MEDHIAESELEPRPWPQFLTCKTELIAAAFPSKLRQGPSSVPQAQEALASGTECSGQVAAGAVCLASCWGTMPGVPSATPNAHTLATEALGPGIVHQEAGPGAGRREARPDSGQPQASSVLAARSSYHLALGPRTSKPSSSGSSHVSQTELSP